MNDIIKIIENINEDIYKSKAFYLTGYTLNLCTLVYYGYGTYIEFLNMTLWNSEEDEREFDEEANEWEPLEPFLRNEINKIIQELSKIKV